MWVYMKLALLMLSLLLTTFSHSAEFTPEQQRRQIIRENLRLVGNNLPLGRMQFQSLCSEAEGKNWCEGYIAAIVTIHQIPTNCLPRSDMAPFIYGSVWEHTIQWLSKQPQDSSFTFYDAITRALSEDDRCPIGEMLQFDAPDYIPYSDAEWMHMQTLDQPTMLQTAEPIYPPAARQEGIKGWTQVSFTVTETGDVRDVFIVESEPPEIFDAASIEAAAKFKFGPYMIRGKIREVPNMQHVFRFNLESD